MWKGNNRTEKLKTFKKTEKSAFSIEQMPNYCYSYKFVQQKYLSLLLERSTTVLDRRSGQFFQGAQFP